MCHNIFSSNLYDSIKIIVNKHAYVSVCVYIRVCRCIKIHQEDIHSFWQGSFRSAKVMDNLLFECFFVLSKLSAANLYNFSNQEKKKKPTINNLFILNVPQTPKATSDQKWQHRLAQESSNGLHALLSMLQLLKGTTLI